MTTADPTAASRPPALDLDALVLPTDLTERSLDDLLESYDLLQETRQDTLEDV
ncbi:MULTISPECIES: hypothetical protein [Arsenicicoccus]|uniref:hypothetical protein n=1 Tax=Arsenicicoccus TaxID=267408 RepID=UPI00257E21F0|nr:MULTISPECIES: hypothetical protein [Arsenicicoccus]